MCMQCFINFYLFFCQVPANFECHESDLSKMKKKKTRRKQEEKPKYREGINTFFNVLTNDFRKSCFININKKFFANSCKNDREQSKIDCFSCTWSC